MAGQHTRLAGLEASNQHGEVQDIQGELTFLDNGTAEASLGRD
jgi:hypothetical protein